ncbi:MAG: hypothetical protein IJZ47_07965 [Oscillospiraceae bacterium]|nr:hypothetical protein [Oscillospiraceae bacterium]
MICDITNASPCNVSVDAEQRVQFKFVFWGDGCTEANVLLYDVTDPTIAPVRLYKFLHDERRTYYNGEEIDCNYYRPADLNGEFLNDRRYIWKVRLYEDVDLDNGKIPSVIHDSITTMKEPYFFGTVQESLTPNEELLVYIEPNLDITLPMWMRIGDDPTYRIVLSYDTVTGFCKLKNKFPTYPAAGSTYSLSSVRSYVPTKEKEINQIFVEKGITQFANAEFVDTRQSETINPWYIECAPTMEGGEIGYYPILDYNSRTGLLTLGGGFSRVFDVGTELVVRTCFIDSRYFPIMAKKTPYFKDMSVLPVEMCGENIRFYSNGMTSKSLIKYYWLDIYEDDVLIETTQRIFMAKLDYYYRKARPGKSYHAVFHVVTQDGMTNQEDAPWFPSATVSTATNVSSVFMINPQSVSIPDMYAEYDSERHAVRFEWVGSLDYGFKVLRKDADGIKLVGHFHGETFYDYTCAANTTYTYYIIPYIKGSDGKCTFYAEQELELTTPRFREWSVYGLRKQPFTALAKDDTRIWYPYQDGLYEYEVEDYWCAAFDLEPHTAFTQNLNRTLYTGDHPKPVAVVGSNNYDSFSLSFSLGKVECPRRRIVLGTISDIKAWKEFLAKGNLVILKDPDGNMWAGALTANTYDKTYYGSRVEYKVNIDFTETTPMDKVLITEWGV